MLNTTTQFQIQMYGETRMIPVSSMWPKIPCRHNCDNWLHRKCQHGMHNFYAACWRGSGLFL